MSPEILSPVAAWLRRISIVSPSALAEPLSRACEVESVVLVANSVKLSSEIFLCHGHWIQQFIEPCLGIIAAHRPSHAVPCRFCCTKVLKKKRFTQPSHWYNIALYKTMLSMMLCPQYISIVGIIADNFRKLCDTFCITFINMILMFGFFRCGINLLVFKPSILSTHFLPPTCLDGFPGCHKMQHIYQNRGKVVTGRLPLTQRNPESISLQLKNPRKYRHVNQNFYQQ